MRLDKPLFTPGPLTTSPTVKEAMLRDLGSRDVEFVACVRTIRERLLALAGVSQDAGYEAVPMQGSGTFAIEAVVSSVLPADGRLLVAHNGAYGRRISGIAARHGVAVSEVTASERAPIDPLEVARALARDASITHVAAVHCETTSGVMNPVDEIGAVVADAGRSFILDSMSAFGGVPFDMQRSRADHLISSANKCIEGVPGFAFVLSRRAALEESAGMARTVSLDLHAQWRGLEESGQFRFTPPTHAMLAFARALDELDAEGGVEGRAARYRGNKERLVEGMAALGFEEYVPREHQGWIITSFVYPSGPGEAWFSFEEFYDRLNDRGFVIYPGKVTDADCFRIGSIGRLDLDDVENLLAAIVGVVGELRGAAG